MSETRYPLGYDSVVRFEYDDYRYPCLCTFPFNYKDHKLDVGTVESLALLGAALCLSVNGGLERGHYLCDTEYILPDCIPRWIRDEIKKILGDYPEEFYEGEYDTDHVDASIRGEEYNKLLIKRFKAIKKWAKQSIKDVENGTY